MEKGTETLLRELATKLGTTSEYLWGVLVAGQTAEGVVALTTAVILGIFWVIALTFCYKSIRAGIKDEWCDESHFARGILGGAFSLALAIPVIGELRSGLIAFLSPEYAALNHLIYLLR